MRGSSSSNRHPRVYYEELEHMLNKILENIKEIKEIVRIHSQYFRDRFSWDGWPKGINIYYLIPNRDSL